MEEAEVGDSIHQESGMIWGGANCASSQGSVSTSRKFATPEEDVDGPVGAVPGLELCARDEELAMLCCPAAEDPTEGQLALESCEDCGIVLSDAQSADETVVAKVCKPA